MEKILVSERNKMDSRLRKINKEQIYLIIIILLAFPIILFSVGTITSGWHLVDDHETLRIVQTKANEGISFFNAFRNECINDMEIRWRPAYWFFRVLEAYVFGLNSIIHNLFLCIMGMATYVLLYKSARNLNGGMLYAHLFALLTIFGRQYEIWFRIANQENSGLFFMSLCLWVISKQYREKLFNKKGYNILFLISVIICSLIKESFLILLPAIVLLRLGLEGNMQKQGIRKWVHLLIKRFPLWGLSLIAFLYSAYMIVFRVGTSSIGYAGVDVDAGWKQVVWNIMRMPKQSLKDFVGITIVLVILLSTVLFATSQSKPVSVDYLLWVFFGIYIVLGEIVLYAKSGMWDRYLIPFVLGYNIVFIVFAEGILKNKYIRLIYVGVLVVFLGTRVYVALVGDDGAVGYGEEGRQVQEMLRYVVKETEEKSNILISYGARETEVATCKFLKYMSRNNVYIYVDDQNEDLWEAEYNSPVIQEDNAKWKVLITGDGGGDVMVKKIIENEKEWKEKQFGDYFTVWVGE